MPTIALLIWPMFAGLIAAMTPRPQALVLIVLIPYLLLPEAFFIPLPGLPDIDKVSIISLSILLAFALVKPRRSDMPPALDDAAGSRILRLMLAACVVVLVVSIFFTVLANREPLVFEERTIQGMQVWDAVSRIADMMIFIIPFFFAQRHLATPEHQRMLLRAIVWATLAYSLLMLIEFRFSPQLHRWVYGFHQHSFAQHVRNGYRPMVFLPHGLHVGFLVFTGLMAATALWKTERTAGWGIAALWLAFILLMSRNLGAAMIAIMFLGVFLFFPLRAKLAMISLVCLMVLTYPLARQTGMVPTGAVLSLAERISPDRAHSLEFRFRHEEALLAKANEKPWSGWGSWGRNRVFDERGNDVSVTDGRWIQVFGTSGWPYYLAFYGILTLPLLVFSRVARQRNLPVETMAIALILTATLIYQIPNNLMSSLSWVMLGTIVGILIRKADPAEDAGKDRTEERGAQRLYSRFPAVGKSGPDRQPHSRTLQ